MIAAGTIEMSEESVHVPDHSGDASGPTYIENVRLTDVGRLINRVRIKRGMGMQALARESGIDSGTISRIERGVIQPTAATLDALMQALGLKIEIRWKDVKVTGQNQ